MMLILVSFLFSIVQINSAEAFFSNKKQPGERCFADSDCRSFRCEYQRSEGRHVCIRAKSKGEECFTDSECETGRCGKGHFGGGRQVCEDQDTSDVDECSGDWQCPRFEECQFDPIWSRKRCR